MSCWTLWQRLTPRYQLSSKEVYVEANSAPSSPRSHSARNLRSGTPKGRNGSPPSSGKDRYDLKNHGQATMYFSVSSPRDAQTELDVNLSPRPAFPVRRSPFINSFKQQQRINSARQNFKDPSTSTPKSHTPSLRARTASHFPVTRLDTHESHVPNHGNCTQTPSGPVKPKTPSRRLQSKSARTVRDNMLSVNTIVPFDQPKPFLKNPLYPESNNKRYVLRDFDDSTMIIDSDRVLFFKKNKTRQNASCESDTASYLAHLRRLYLKEPKDLAKFVKTPVSDQNKKNLIRERMEYDKRAHTILNYYSREDDIQTATAWANSVDASFRNRQQNESKSTPSRVSSSRLPRRVVSPRSPRRSATTRPNSARYNYQQEEREQQPRQPPTDALEDWNVFLKINSRSTLHERQFYLRTPANHPTSSPDSQKVCSCRLCRLEIEIALLRQKHGDHVVFVPQTKDDENIAQYNTASHGIGTSNMIADSGASELERHHVNTSTSYETPCMAKTMHSNQHCATTVANQESTVITEKIVADGVEITEQDGGISAREDTNDTRQDNSDVEQNEMFFEKKLLSESDNSIKVPRLETDIKSPNEIMTENEAQTTTVPDEQQALKSANQMESNDNEIITIPLSESAVEQDIALENHTSIVVAVQELPESQIIIDELSTCVKEEDDGTPKNHINIQEHPAMSNNPKKQVNGNFMKDTTETIDLESITLPRSSTEKSEELNDDRTDKDLAESPQAKDVDCVTIPVIEIYQS